MKQFRGVGGRKSVTTSCSNTTSSIRGKISAPIPITVTDDEFPIRIQSTDIAISLVSEALERGPRAVPIPRQLETIKQEEADISTSIDEPSRAAPSVPSPMAPPYSNRTLQGRQVSPLRGSVLSNPSASSTERPQRKKSTLRSVLGRLFSKRAKNSSSVNGHHKASPRAGQHRSDPSALRKPTSQILSPQRSVSMPISDFNRALRSHSPLAEDPETQDSINVQDSKVRNDKAKPGRSTTPSRLYEPTRTPGYMNWVGLSPRPASSHARDSGAFTGVDGDGLIGFAVTNGSHSNRRSRSLGQLQDAALQHGVRRRSDEIRYWRESYPSFDPDPLSPISSHHRPETDFRPTTQEGDPLPDHVEHEVPQPFNFGPLGELAGMKITQAASLDFRVSILESRLDRMEKEIANLHDRISASVLPIRDYGSRPRTDSSDQSHPRHTPSRMYQQTHNPQANTSYRLENSSFDSSRPSTTSTQPSKHQSYEELSPRPTYPSSPDPAPEVPLLRSNLSARHSESMGRPLSTSTTIRGIASSSPSRTPDRMLSFSKNGALTAHHYSALLNLITAEQSARQVLEAQVVSMQRQLQSLTSKSGENSSAMSSNPRPIHVPGRQTLGTGQFSSFEHDDSGTESDEETSGCGNEEIFQTPDEERGQYAVHDAYGDELVEMEGHRTEPRTLSLSQLTMGRSALASVGV